MLGGLPLSLGPMIAWLASADYAHGIFLAGLIVMATGVPLVPTNTQKTIVMTIGFGLAVAGFRALLDRTAVSWTILDTALVVYLGSAILTMMTRERPLRLLTLYPSLMRSDGILTLAMYVALAMLASRLGSADRNLLIQAILWGGGLVATVTITQSRGGGQWALPEGATKAIMDTTIRACGTLGNPLFLGGYCAMLLPVAIWGAAIWGRTDDAIIGILLAYTLGMSGTRSGTIAAMFGVLVALWLHPSWMIIWYAVAAGAIMFAAGAAPETPRSLLRRMGEAVRDIVHPPGSGRKYIWGKTLKLIRQRLRFGWGHNTLQVPNPDANAQDQFDNPHSVPLYVTYTTGLVGLACYLAIWTVALFHTASISAVFGPGLAGVSVAYPFSSPLLAGLVAYAAWGLTGFEHIGVSNVAWAFLGMAFAR